MQKNMLIIHKQFFVIIFIIMLVNTSWTQFYYSKEKPSGKCLSSFLKSDIKYKNSIGYLYFLKAGFCSECCFDKAMTHC